MKNSWFRSILRRRIFVILLLLIQIVFIAFVFLNGNTAVKILSAVFRAIAIYIAAYVIYKDENIASKTCWVFWLLLFPIVGVVLYLLFHYQASAKSLTKHTLQLDEKTRPLYKTRPDVLAEAAEKYPEYKNQFSYLQNTVGYPVYDRTEVKYFSPGEAFFPVLLEALRSAQKYIFLEYFIIGSGEMWTQILEILKEKAAGGVDVRVIYDDMGCFVTLPKNCQKQLEACGIQCVVFNPFRPILSTIQNNRDHRKIASIDGKIVFTGGINLADEYINLVEKHGYWKDCAVRLTGKAAWSMTLMFLEMWKLCKKTQENFSDFHPGDAFLPESDGYVQPYADSPLDRETVGEQVYLRMIHDAKDYLYITSPYFVVDDNMVAALTLAAKSGVDVRIILPYYYDHALVHATAKSYYRRLIEGGVKVYEYSIGFMHSKIYVSDDKIATIGTINMDYRSLYLHFECGTVLCGCSAVQDIKNDFLQTLDDCHAVELKECRMSLPVRLFQEVLRLFAPLM